MKSGIYFRKYIYPIALNTFCRIRHSEELLSRFRNPVLKSFVVIDRMKLQNQVQLWNKYLPQVMPYYAVKSNNNTTLMRWMTELFDNKMGFDCASINEMETARKVSKVVPIIYAQPCKTKLDISESVRYGIQATVVDSPEETIKLAKSGWKGNVLIRLLVPDSDSKQPFGKKFGAPISWVPQIIDEAKRYKIPITGVSFHVGSECEKPDQFRHALRVCKLAMDIASESKIHMDTIDIGGGFLPSESNIAAVSSAIQSACDIHFHSNTSSAGKPLKWIAEPGRFLSSTTQTLYTPVIGRKRSLPDDTTEFRYTLHESVYGYFSNIPFDGQKPKFEIAYQMNKPLIKNRLHKSILFGRTCDGADIINPDIELPFMEEGDWIRVENMGAYTNVSASEFNGFPKPDPVYLQ